MALTKSFLQRRELTIPVTKERCAASSSEFLPIWASDSLRQKAERLSSHGSRSLQASDIYSPIPPNLSSLTFESSPSTNLGSQWVQFQDPQGFPGAAAACSHDREISPIPDQEERRTLERQALEEEAIAIAELQEDEESFAVGAMPEPGQYRYEPFDQEEVLSRPHQPRFFQEPKNLKDFSWVAEDESFQVDGITNLTNHLGAFSRSFLFGGEDTTQQENETSQESIETVDLVTPLSPIGKFRELDRFEMYDRFKKLVLRLHDERNTNKAEDERVMKIFLNSIALCGEFDSDYIADSLGEAQPENTRLPSYRSMLSNVSRGTVHMEPVPRKTYVPMSPEERREKIKKYAHSSQEILDKIAADVRSKDRVIEDNGRGLVITVETIRKMSNRELAHWINTRKAAVNRQQFLIGGRPAPKIIANFLRTRSKAEQKRLLHQMNGGGLFDIPPPEKRSLRVTSDSDDDDDQGGGAFERRPSHASSLGRAAIPHFKHSDAHESDWDRQLQAYQDEVVHRIMNPFFRPKGERHADPSRQAAVSKAPISQFAVEGTLHVPDGEEVEEFVRSKMPKNKTWSEAAFSAKDDFTKKQWQGKMERTRLVTEEEKRLAKVHRQHAQEIRTHTKHHHIKKEDYRYKDINRYGGIDGRTKEPAINYSSRIPYLNQFNNYAVVTKKTIS